MGHRDHHTDVLIIGGGLAGLALAERLTEAGIDFLLAEARDRLGGRILTHSLDGAGFDLGPAWFWPGQPRMASLVDRLGIQYFEQYVQGDMLVETGRGPVQRGSGYAAMAGSYRVAGGLSAVIDGLQNRIEPGRIRLGQVAVSMEPGKEVVRTRLADPDADQSVVTSTSVVLAIPPRVAAERIDFGAALGAPVLDALRRIPTWMAGQAKIIAIYEEPFWRNAGLSGDAMSHVGPMVEIHDASPETGGPFALFGFVGFPADVREAHREDIVPMAKDQLVRLFGEAAAQPKDVVLQDWAIEPLTATEADWSGPGQHPAYGLPPALDGLLGGRLFLGSSEVGSQFGGYLEGALEAAAAVADQVIATAAARSGSPSA